MEKQKSFGGMLWHALESVLNVLVRLCAWLVSTLVQVVGGYPRLVLVPPALVVGLAFLAPMVVQANWWKDDIIRIGQQELGRALAVRRIDWRLLPRPKIILRDVELGNRKGGSFNKMAYIKKLDISLKWNALWQGELAVQEVHVNRGIFYLETLKHGIYNWEFSALRADDKKVAQDFAPPAPNNDAPRATSVPFHYLHVTDSVVAWLRQGEPCYQGMATHLRKAASRIRQRERLKEDVCAHLLSKVDDMNVFIDIVPVENMPLERDGIDVSWLYHNVLQVQGRVSSLLWQGWRFEDGDIDLALEDGTMHLEHFEGRLNGGSVVSSAFLQHGYDDDGLAYWWDMDWQNVAFPSGAWLGDSSHYIIKGRSDMAFRIEGEAARRLWRLVLASLNGSIDVTVRDAYVSGVYATAIRKLLLAKNSTGFIGALAETLFGESLVQLSLAQANITLKDGRVHSENIILHVDDGDVASQSAGGDDRTHLSGWLDAHLPEDSIEARLTVRTPEGGLFEDVGLEMSGALRDPDFVLRGIGEGDLLGF
ncbi:MAG: AsmA family protein [Alphaproteobacteria bacterium GM202ARS2]|nr:AsmA family protein [Alphaproteobacteria bacterium GM202ARS2]